MRTSRAKRRRSYRPVPHPRLPRLRRLRGKPSSPSTSRACRPSIRSAPSRTFEGFWHPVCLRICRARRSAERGWPIPGFEISSACPRIHGTSMLPAACRGLGRYRARTYAGSWLKRPEKETRRRRRRHPSFRRTRDLQWLARQFRQTQLLGISPRMTSGPLRMPASLHIGPAHMTLQCSMNSIRTSAVHPYPSDVTAVLCQNESRFIA
jgi:hypothetical protein